MRTNRTSAGAALADAALLVYAVGVSLKCSQRRQSGHYQDQLWRGYMSVLSIGKNASEIARLMFRPYLILTKAKKSGLLQFILRSNHSGDTRMMPLTTVHGHLGIVA